LELFQEAKKLKICGCTKRVKVAFLTSALWLVQINFRPTLSLFADNP
jgi:hypothetical protein